METIDIFQGLKKGGKVVLNSAHLIAIEGYQTHCVDLTGIAIGRTLMVAGSPVVNTPLLGALAKIGIITLNDALAAIRGMFTDERNVLAAEDAYRELVL